MLTDDVPDDLLDHVFPDFVLVFAGAGGATYVITLQDYPLLIPFLQMVAPEEAVPVKDFHLLHHVFVQFMNLERAGFMFIEVKNDEIFLDVPFAEILIGIVTDSVCDHKGVVSVQMQIQDIFRNLIFVGSDHIILVIPTLASPCGQTLKQEDN